MINYCILPATAVCM